MAFLSNHRNASLTSIPVFCSSFPFWCPLVPAVGTEGVRLCPRGTWTLTFALGSPRVLLVPLPLLPLLPFESPHISRGSSSSSKADAPPPPPPSLLLSWSPISLSLSPLPSLVVELLPLPRSSDSLDEVRLGWGLSGIRMVPVDVAFLADLDIWLREGTNSLMTDVMGAIGLSTWPRVNDHEALRECDRCCCSIEGLTAEARGPAAAATLLPFPWGRSLGVDGVSSSIPTSRPPVAMASSRAVFIASLIDAIRGGYN